MHEICSALEGDILSTEAPPPTPAGWHTDPKDPTLNRWWNGSQWTEHSAPKVAPPGQANVVQGRKDVGIAYLFAVLLGGFAAHHFYLGRIGSAVGFLALWWIGWATAAIYIGIVLLIAAAIWFIVDLFLIPGYVRDCNARAGVA